MYERSEIVTQQRTRAFISSDADHEGLTATLDEVDLCVITYASIEGQSALRVPHAILPALLQLVNVLAAEEPVVVPPDPPAEDAELTESPATSAGLSSLKETR